MAVSATDSNRRVRTYARWCGRGRRVTAAPMPILLTTRKLRADLPFVLRLDCRFALDWKVCLLPGIKAANHVGDVLEASSLQQAARDHAAITALTMDRNRPVAVDCWGRYFEIVQRPPGCIFDMSGVPLGFAAHIEHLGSVSLHTIAQNLHRDLWQFSERKSCLFPCSYFTIQISKRIFNAYSRQSKARFRHLFRRIGDQHRTGGQTKNRSCPGGELSRQGNVD